MAAESVFQVNKNDLESITLQLKWRHAFQFAGYYAAKEQGYYRNAGLNVTILEHPGKISPVQVLLSGDAQYAVSGSEIVVHRAQGDPVVVLAAIFQHSPYAFLVTADSGLNLVEDFSGLRIMETPGLERAELQATLLRAGISPGDYIALPTSFDPWSLIRGETDVFNAYATDQGFTLQQAGIEIRYFLPAQYGVDFYGDVLVTTEREASSHPQRLRKFLDASLRGWRYALDNPDELVDLILANYNSQAFSREHLEYEVRASRELIQPLLVKLGHMNPARWEHIRDIYEELNIIETGASIEGLVYKESDNSGSVVRWIAQNWIRVSSALVIFIISALVLILFQTRRIIRRRTAELAESERHWRELIDAEPACVKTIDCDGRLMSMNAAGLAMIQANSFQQVCGLKVLELVEEEDKLNFQLLNDHVFAGESDSLQFRLRGLKGKQVWLETHAVPFRDATGSITRQLAVTQDITEQKAEQARHEKLQQELSQTHKMEALGQLSGGVAHDFNNLLGIIGGYTGLALDANPLVSQEERTKYLGTVIDATTRAKSIVSQMLAFSRADSSEEIVLEPGPLIDEDIKLLRSMLPSSIEIKLKKSEDLPLILIDPIQMQQLLMNLSINARDAMGGSGILTINLSLVSGRLGDCHCCHQLVAGDWVEISVSDTGCGITENELAHIFEPFYTTKPVGEGTGMGLSVIHGIMDRDDRHILVESAVSHGTTFRLLFTPAMAADTDIVSSKSTYETTPRGHGQNILVVDDEPDLAAMVGSFLSLGGYNPTILSDSLKALEAFKEDPQKYELLITDQTMPGLTGLNLIEEVKALRPEIPVILCSGFKAEEDEATIDRLVNTYIAKPYKMQFILASVAELIL